MTRVDYDRVMPWQQTSTARTNQSCRLLLSGLTSTTAYENLCKPELRCIAVKENTIKVYRNLDNQSEGLSNTGKPESQSTIT